MFHTYVKLPEEGASQTNPSLSKPRRPRNLACWSFKRENTPSANDTQTLPQHNFEYGKQALDNPCSAVKSPL